LLSFAFPNDAELPSLVAEFPRVCTEVSDAFGVVWYEVSGRRYYAIPSWDAHQKNERKAASKYPPPPEGVSAGQRPHWATVAEMRGTSEPTHGSSGTGTGEQGNRGTGEEDTPASADAEQASDDEPAPDPLAEDFTLFWSHYPRKRNRAEAFKAYRAARRKASAATILDSLRRQLPELQAEQERYQPHGATWLRGERWENQATVTTLPTREGNGWEVSPFLSLPAPDPEIADDPARYQQWLGEQRERIKRERATR
jgi:hypothetical protein